MSVNTLEPDMMESRLLTEIERQQATLDELPEDYEFPLFDGRQAIESQRKSGYKNTARAAREIIDNGFESGAKNVWVVFRRAAEGERAKNERRDAVSAVAFIDDGPGMLPLMAQYALSWGGGTHFNDPTGIGRFGFGLPNSSINQRRGTKGRPGGKRTRQTCRPRRPMSQLTRRIIYSTMYQGSWRLIGPLRLTPYLDNSALTGI